MATAQMVEMLDYVANCSDIELSVLTTAIQERKRRDHEKKARQQLATLKVGDKVQLANCKPKYINGTLGTIVARRNAKFVVELAANCDPRAKARFGGRPICPPTILRKIED